MTTLVTPDPKELREAIEKILDKYGGDYKPREYSDKILALFTQAQQKLLSELVEQLPEKQQRGNENPFSPAAQRRIGFNDCRNLVTTLINKYREGMK